MQYRVVIAQKAALYSENLSIIVAWHSLFYTLNGRGLMHRIGPIFPF